MALFFKQFVTAVSSGDTHTVAFRYKPSDSRSYALKGEVFILITISGLEQAYTHRVAKFLWDGVLDKYLYSELDILDSLKEALQSGRKSLLEVMRNDPELETKGIDLSFALAVHRLQTVYFGLFGEQKIYFIKSGKVHDISSMLSSKQAAAGSSMFAVEDVLAMSSPGGLENLSKAGALGKALKGEDISKALSLDLEEPSAGQGTIIISQSRALLEVLQSFDPYEENESIKENENGKVIKTPQIKDIYTPGGISEPPLSVPKQNDQANQQALPQNVQSTLTHQRSKDDDKRSREFLKRSNAVLGLWNKLINNLSGILSKVFKAFREKTRALIAEKYGRKQWFKKLMFRLTQIQIFKAKKPDALNVSSYKDKELRNRRFAILFLVVLIILIIGLGIKATINTKNNLQLHKQFEAEIAGMQPFIDDANKKINTDVSGSELALFKAQQAYSKITFDKGSLSDDDKAKLDALVSEMEMIDDKLNKRNDLSEKKGNITRLLDTKISFGTNSDPTDIAIMRDEAQQEFLFITDRGEKAVYRVALPSGKATKIADGDNVAKSPEFVDVGVSGIYVYDSISGVLMSGFNEDMGNEPLHTLGGISGSSFSGKKVTEFAILTDQDNAYFLSTADKSILKSTKTSSGTYSLPFNYISDESFISGSDLFADLSIYITTNDGRAGFHRYNFSPADGALVSSPLSISELKDPFVAITAGYTGGSLDNKLYLFDNARLMIFEKPQEGGSNIKHPGSLVYIKQFVYRGSKKNVFKDVKDIVVNHNETKAYILDGKSIWEVSL